MKINISAALDSIPGFSESAQSMEHFVRRAPFNLRSLKLGSLAALILTGTTACFPLITQDHNDSEAEADTLMGYQIVQDEIQNTVATLLASPYGAVPANQADATMYATELARSLAKHASNHDPYRPAVTWIVYPGARTGLDNPDTIYREIPVTSNAAYVITGKRNASSALYIQLFDSWPGTDGTAGTGLAFLDDNDLVLEEDGSFTITLDDQLANGRTNHIQLPPDSHALVIRDTLSNWWQIPAELHVERTAPSNAQIPPPPQESDLASLTAANMAVSMATWLGFTDQLSRLPANFLIPPIPTTGGLPGQYNSAGTFALGPGDAMIVTVDPGTADYVGFQLGSSFFASFEYTRHTSNFASGHTWKNNDGTITYVISLSDPGVWNWLDPVGHPSGLIFIRWQGTTTAPTVSPLVQVVNISDLPSVLPAETKYVDALQRKSQIDIRFLAYLARLVPIED